MNRETLLNIQKILNKCDLAALGMILAGTIQGEGSKFLEGRAWASKILREQILFAMSPCFDDERLDYTETVEKLFYSLSGYVNGYQKDVENESLPKE